MTGEPIYLDHNATTPIDPRVVEAMARAWTDCVANPASQHAPGRKARRMLEEAREGIAELLGAKTGGMDSDRVIFTSGGTEANNLALLGLRGQEDERVLVSAIEHPSTKGAADELWRRRESARRQRVVVAFIDNQTSADGPHDRDMQLVHQMVHGEREAQSQARVELLGRYVQNLQMFFQQLFGDKEQASRLSGKAIMKVLHGDKRCPPDANFRTWLLSVAHEVAAEAWQARSRVHVFPIDPHGLVDVDRFDEFADGGLKDPIGRIKTGSPLRLVSVMLANNETGIIQPVDRISKLCREREITMHTDAVQAVGKIRVHFGELGVDAMTVAPHKFHGPLGIGALVLRNGVQLQPQLFGGFQQEGLRPGTENVALAVGFHKALALATAELDERAARMQSLRDELEHSIRQHVPDVVIIGESSPRLPNTSNMSFPGLDRQALVMALDLAGVACSTGSACASGSSEPSPVLIAMGLPKTVVEGSIRLSLGAFTTAAEVAEGARRIINAVNHLRSQE